LLVAICVLNATANDKVFEKNWREDVALNRILLKQQRQVVAPVLQKSHQAPRKDSDSRECQEQSESQGSPKFRQEPRGTKSQSRECPETCPAGFTGIYCENPICDEKAPIMTKNIKLTVIEKQYLTRCQDPLTILIDSTLDLVRISVQTLDNANPGGQLYDTKNQPIQSNRNRAQSTMHTFNYNNLPQTYGIGEYKFVANSTDDHDCLVTVSSNTSLVVFGGFIGSKFEDKVQDRKPDGVSVQKNPVMFQASYFALTTVNADYGPMRVTFHIGNSPYEVDSVYIKQRFNCNANYISDQYYCTDTSVNTIKVQGFDNVDTNQNWQRVYTFQCESQQ